MDVDPELAAAPEGLTVRAGSLYAHWTFVDYHTLDLLLSIQLLIMCEAVTTIGANGAGKTTLLKTIAGLIRPRRGRISLEGENVTSWSAERRARAGIALVPEGRQVFPDLSVRDNLLLGAYGRRRQSGITEDIDKVVALFPILGERGQQLAGTLSGGQQQMLAIGRALMSRPKVLLLDEPSLGLAPLAVREVVDKLVALAEAGSTLVLGAECRRCLPGRGPRLRARPWRSRGRGIIETLREDPRVHSAYLGKLG